MHPDRLPRKWTSAVLGMIEAQFRIAVVKVLVASRPTSVPVWLTSRLVLILHPLVRQLVRHVARKLIVLEKLNGLTDLTKLLVTPAELLIGICLNMTSLLWAIEKKSALAQPQPSLS